MRRAGRRAARVFSVLRVLWAFGIFGALGGIAHGEARPAPATASAAPPATAPAAAGPASAPFARAVAGPRFLIGGAWVHDQSTDLVWQRCSIGQRWDEANGCVGLARKMWFTEARQLEADGWRLPRLAELKTIIDVRRNAMVDADAFPDAPATWYWALDAQGQPTAWGPSCDQGGNDICDRGSARALRLVRTAPYRPWSGK